MNQSQRFRKKPVEIDAWQWDGKAIAQTLPEWLRNSNVTIDHGEGVLHIKTPERTMTISKGDWILRGTKGELYPSKPNL